MFDFEFTGTSYGHEIDREGAIEAATAKARELLGDDWKRRMYEIDSAILTDVATDADREAWQQIENAATLAAFDGRSETPDKMSLVWR